MAERRKNEPQLEASQDHLVRKLFSRFRKGGDRISTGSSLQTDTSSVKDVEKGESARASDSENDQSITEPVHKVFPAAKVSTEKDDTATAPAPAAPPAKAPAPKPKGRWGAMLGGGGGGGGGASGGASGAGAGSASPTPSLSQQQSQESVDHPESKVQKITASVETAPAEPSKLSKLKALTGASGQPAGSGNKVFPKQSKPLVASGRQETIEELTETASVGSPAKSPPQPGGHPLAPVSVTPAVQTSSSAALLSSTTTSTEYQQLITNIMDFKIDVKLEIQRLNQRMNKLEDLLSDIVVKLNQQLNGPAMSGTTAPPSSSTQSQYSHRLLSPTSPMHSDTGGHERDTSPASGTEAEQEGGRGRSHRSGHHHHHKHRDRDRRHREHRDRDKDRDKTPDTLSPESRVSSSDQPRSKDKKGGRSKERPKTAASSSSAAGAGQSSSTARTSTTDSATAAQHDDGEEQGGKPSTSKEPLRPPKAVIIPTGQRSREFL